MVRVDPPIVIRGPEKGNGTISIAPELRSLESTFTEASPFTGYASESFEAISPRGLGSTVEEARESQHFKKATTLDLSVAESQKEQLMPSEEKYFEKYLDSRISNIEAAVGHQTEQLGTIVKNLEKNIDRVLTESAAIKKESADNNRWWNRLLVASVVGVLALFVGLIYFVTNLTTSVTVTVNRDVKDLRQEYRSDFTQLQRTIESEIAKIVKSKP